MTIDELLEKPFCLIDVLPEQVPEDSEGQYFKVEYYFRTEMKARIRERMLGLLLKLNCYYALTVSAPEDEEGVQNPAPEILAERLKKQELNILAGPALITSDPEDHYMTVYNADERMKTLLSKLAVSEGLFLREPVSDQ
ncbi:MAG: hypothetical protein IKR59_03790 [Lachnospiraceae bacterium]|nr:hypothetical protein [Lachnospiraceae bacterium]